MFFSSVLVFFSFFLSNFSTSERSGLSHILPAALYGATCGRRDVRLVPVPSPIPLSARPGESGARRAARSLLYPGRRPTRAPIGCPPAGKRVARQGAAVPAVPRDGGASGTEREGPEGHGQGGDSERGRHRMRAHRGHGSHSPHNTHGQAPHGPPHARTQLLLPPHTGMAPTACEHTHLGARREGQQAGPYMTRWLQSHCPSLKPPHQKHMPHNKGGSCGPCVCPGMLPLLKQNLNKASFGLKPASHSHTCERCLATAQLTSTLPLATALLGEVWSLKN